MAIVIPVMFLSVFRPDGSKLEASGEVNDEFPDALREPILRRVQFSQVPRIDHLGSFFITYLSSEQV